MTFSSRARWLARSLALLGLLLAGCGRGNLPAEADLDRARQALTQGLEAWKKGEVPLSLHGQSIYFNDPQWVSGGKLADFKIEPSSEQRHGLSARYAVELTLTDGTKTRQRKMLYQVDTGSSVVIVPADN